MSSEVLVVGGGVAGLVAARRLAIAGRRVRLIERESRWGGQLQPWTVGGVTLDGGAESFATRGGVVASLLSDLGLAARIQTPLASPAWLYDADARARPLPAASLLGIPSAVFRRDVWRSIGTLGVLRAGADAVLPGRIGARAESLGALVSARMGHRVVDRLVAPITRGVHSRHPDELSLAAASPLLKERLRAQGSLARAVRSIRSLSPAGSAVQGLDGGMYRLIDALTSDLIQRGATLQTGAVATRAGGHTVVDGTVHEGPVLWAAGDTDAPRTTLSLVQLLVHAPGLTPPPRGTGMLVAAGAPGVHARALTHLSAKWPWISAALDSPTTGIHALRLSYDGDTADAAAVAAHDASVLLGREITVLDLAVRSWRRPSRPPQPATLAAGEDVSGTGLAAVIAGADAAARTALEEWTL